MPKVCKTQVSWVIHSQIVNLIPYKCAVTRTAVDCGDSEKVEKSSPKYTPEAFTAQCNISHHHWFSIVFHCFSVNMLNIKSAYRDMFYVNINVDKRCVDCTTSNSGVPWVSDARGKKWNQRPFSGFFHENFQNVWPKFDFSHFQTWKAKTKQTKNK